MENVKHEIPPIFDKNSKILVLGSFPSVKSRESQFFYHHPQNRFWKVLSSVIGVDTPTSIEEKKKFLLDNNIALWDVIDSCDIEGSSDSSIKNVVTNDLDKIIEKLNNNIETKINKEEMNLKNLGSLLHNLSPLRTLDRGYSIINKEDVVVNSVLKVSENDEIEVVLSDGSLDCTVNKINKKEG